MNQKNEQIQDNKADLASRLGPAHVGIRSDLEVHRHLFHEKPAYVIRDPLTLHCHQLNLREYNIFTNITPQRSLAEIFHLLVKQNFLQQKNEDEFYRFIVNLHQYALLNLPITDNKALYRRLQAKKKARRKEVLLGFLFLRIPLFNPDAFLNKTANWCKPIFSLWFVPVWIILMSISAIIIAVKYDELFAPLNQILTRHNLIIMWITLILLKMFHEFGHAYACKIFGGQVPEMGIYLIALTPCAYVDVTSSWKFTRKRKRLLVGLGGVYIESIIAALGLMVWNFSSEATVRGIAYNVFFLAGVVTVLMNINPLMRFDGYYVLSDLVEIPNLRQRSRKYVMEILKKVFMGIKVPGQNDSLPIKTMLFVYGVAGTLYRMTVILSISAVIAAKVFLLGLAMAGFYVSMELVKNLRGLIRYLWFSPESAEVRVRAVVISILLLTGVPGLLFCLPVPHNVYASGQLERKHEHVIRAQVDGFIREISGTAGETVTSGRTLVKMENDQLHHELLETKANLEKTNIQLAAYHRDHLENEAEKQKETINALLSELQYRHINLEKLNVQAIKDGVLINNLDQKEIGRFIRQGEPIGTIGDGPWITRVLLTEQDVADAQPQIGREIQFRLFSQADNVLPGKIIGMAPKASRDVNLPALTTIGEGEIIADPAANMTLKPYYEVTIVLSDTENYCLRHGMTGVVRLKAHTKPFGISLIQKFLRFINTLNIN